MVPLVGYVIFGTQMSLAMKPTGAANKAVEAERRTARTFVNFMFIDLVFHERYKRRVGGSVEVVVGGRV